MRVDPDELDRRAQVLESLRNLVPQIDATQRVYIAGLGRRDAIGHEKGTLLRALAVTIPPSRLAFFLFIELLWIGVAGLAFAGHEYFGAVLGTLSIIMLVWYRKRTQRAAALEQQIAACSKRLKLCEDELRRTENEAREIESECRRLTGRAEVTQNDIDERAAELARLSKLSDELRSLDEAFAHLEADLRRILQRIEDTEKNIAALLSEASAASEQEFVDGAEVYKQRQQLRQELEKIPADVPESGMLFDTQADEESEFETAQRELAELEQRLVQVRHETGRVEERITMMEKSEERSRALSRQETILARIDEAAEQWAVLTLCRAMLDETRRIYETERQPEVIRQASSFFSVMTERRYTRVIAPLDGGEIQVERADGARLSPQLLSRGTTEQLYLSMRLALVREYANHVDPLPVVFDDIFVNFDPGRSRTSFKAIRDLSTTHQVLLFTCHPHLIGQVEEIVPEARLFAL
ncbi:MAG: hypothetical protein DMG13_03350 [Acidobacteria bacterium]|nr:MAG: hypothetical protein DMG13_03350 [Acidobacteriota bacterium]